MLVKLGTRHGWHMNVSDETGGGVQLRGSKEFCRRLEHRDGLPCNTSSLRKASRKYLSSSTTEISDDLGTAGSDIQFAARYVPGGTNEYRSVPKCTAAAPAHL